MGRPRGGKGKKSIESAKNEDAGSGGEEVIPAYKRRGRPQKLLKDDIDEEEDIAKIEEDGDSTKTIVPSKDSKGSVENGGKKRRQLKRSSDSVMEKDEPSRPSGFRQNASRRKSTPRRAAEAGVECK